MDAPEEGSQTSFCVVFASNFYEVHYKDTYFEDFRGYAFFASSESITLSWACPGFFIALRGGDGKDYDNLARIIGCLEREVSRHF